MAADVLLIVEARIATVQLLEQILSELSRSRGFTWRTREDRLVTVDDFTPDTFPLIVRATTPAALQLARIMRRAGIDYGFYIDDNFWKLDPATPLGRHYLRRSTRRVLDYVIRAASVVIASTPLLSDELKRLNDNVLQLDAPRDLRGSDGSPQSRDRRGILTMGFAGSTGRGVDLQPLMAEVIAALDRHRRLRFEVIGPVEGVPVHDRISVFPYLDNHDDYVAFLNSRQWDFALAPLGGAESNRYKTDAKYRDYAAHRIPGIYQDAPPYAGIEHGRTGLIAGEPDQWRAAIDRYAADAGLRNAVAAAAFRDVESRYRVDLVAARWAEFLSQAPGAGQGAANWEQVRAMLMRYRDPAQRPLLRGVLLWEYGRTHLQEHGFRTTAWRTARFVGRRLVPGRRGGAVRKENNLG